MNLLRTAESLRGKLDRLIASPILWVVFLTLGVAALLRQYLFAHSYWYDEAFLILAIRERCYAALLGPQPYNLVIPPVFLWAVRGLHELAGDAELCLRLPAFAAAVLALILMIPLARKLVGRPHALWAFAWLAISRNLLAHACEVRPYTLDLLLGEAILLCSAVLLDPASRPVPLTCAAAGLSVLAAVGPWVSFPTVFVLGGASLAIAVQLFRHGSAHGLRRAFAGTWSGWALWLGLNALLGISALGLWWLSGRHMYYGGMLEHWGHKGWWGFPDWHSPANMCRWLIWRPYDLANYGNRELGVVLPLFALMGGLALAKRSPSLGTLLITPFALALTAALLGKYPLAHRTAFFLLPCLWLLAAAGFAVMVEWARRHGRELALAGLLLVAWDTAWLLVRLARPDPGLDYRGAYAFVQAHRQAGDAVWAQMAVVYEVYYGKNAAILKDADFAEAKQLARSQRLWAVLGQNRHDLQQELAAAAGQIVLCHHLNGVTVLLLEPKSRTVHVTSEPRGAKTKKRKPAAPLFIGETGFQNLQKSSPISRLCSQSAWRRALSPAWERDRP